MVDIFSRDDDNDMISQARWLQLAGLDKLEPTAAELATDELTGVANRSDFDRKPIHHAWMPGLSSTDIRNVIFRFCYCDQYDDEQQHERDNDDLTTIHHVTDNTMQYHIA